MEVVDDGFGQRLGEALLAELREAARPGRGADIDQHFYAARAQQIDEALDGMVGMTDCPDRIHDVSRRTRSMKASVAAERSSRRQARLSGTFSAGRPFSIR